MDDFGTGFGEFDDAVVAVRADTQRFRSEVEAMRRELADGLGGAADIAGRRIEGALLRAVRTGKLGFDDLKRTALSIIAQIASAAVQSGLQSIFAGTKGGAGGGSGQSLAAIGTQLLSAWLGSPGRATGGPVAPGRAYTVGERGPELFVPTTSGRVEPMAGGGGGARDVRLTININAPDTREPEALARSSRQVARAVKGVLARS